MIMILRYMVIAGDYDTPYHWDSMYAGEFATVEAAVAQGRAMVGNGSEDYYEVIDLMTKKVVAEGTYKELMHERHVAEYKEKHP